jgi:hypothetical protein
LLVNLYLERFEGTFCCAFEAGWPDWRIFDPICHFFLLAVFRKKMRGNPNVWPTFSTVKAMHSFRQMRWATFWAFFSKTHLVTLLLGHVAAIWNGVAAQKAIFAPREKVANTVIIFLYSASGSPDGLFSNPKSQFGKILERLRLETVNIFYGHYVWPSGHHVWPLQTLGYFMNIWYILCSFGTMYQEKSGNPTGHEAFFR